MRVKSILSSMTSRLSYANVVGTMALFIALGGVSYAATSLPKNSVSSKAIKKNAVTAPKIKKNAVTTTKIKNRSLLGGDFKSQTVTGAQINESSLTGVTAASAATADNVVSFAKVADAGVGIDQATARAAAPEIPLVSHGQVSAYGKCFYDTVADVLYWETYVRTTTDGASIQGYSIQNSQYRFGPSTDPLNLRIQYDSLSNPSVNDDYGDDAFLIGQNGQGIAFSVFTFAQSGNPATSPAYIIDRQCSFQLSGTKIG